eukprot:GHVR01033671.1.p1 GENE.GHVR01033671.1~~GHVR01033671.1.p1  ORF type:complete len:113 (+),score=4.12 GHVR01033671.1:860-1198(+)
MQAIYFALIKTLRMSYYCAANMGTCCINARPCTQDLRPCTQDLALKTLHSRPEDMGTCCINARPCTQDLRTALVLLSLFSHFCNSCPSHQINETGCSNQHDAFVQHPHKNTH